MIVVVTEGWELNEDWETGEYNCFELIDSLSSREERSNGTEMAIGARAHATECQSVGGNSPTRLEGF